MKGTSLARRKAEPSRDGPQRNVLRKMLGGILLSALLIFSGCAQPVNTTATSTKATTTTAATAKGPSTPVTSSLTATAKPPTAATPAPPTAAQMGPYGEMKIAKGTFGNERFDPVTSDMTHTSEIAPFMDYMFWTEKRELKPGIVEKWQLAADGLSWTYYIRKGVKFHNGDDLTAADVKFSIEQYMRPDATNANMRGAVSRVETVDDYGLRISTKGRQPYLPNLSSVTTPGQGLVMPKSYVERNGTAYFEQHPIGSGSFKFVRTVRGDSVEYEAVEKHWRVVPAFKKLTIMLVPEQATMVAMLRTGAADIVEADLDGAVVLEKAGFGTFVADIIMITPQVHGATDPRAAGMPTADIRVRRALWMAINRDDIKNNFFYGKMGPPMPAQTGADMTDIDVPYWQDYAARIYKYDPEQAKQLLREAGYPNGFSVKMYAYSAPGVTYLPKLAEVVQGYWAKIGIKAEVTIIDFGTYTTWRRGPADQLVGQITMHRLPSNPFAPERLLQAYGSTGTTALLGKGNSVSNTFDQFIGAAYTETDTAKRKEMLANAIKISTDTYVACQIGSAPTMGAYGPRVDISGWSLPLSAAYIGVFASSVKHGKQN